MSVFGGFQVVCLGFASYVAAQQIGPTGPDQPLRVTTRLVQIATIVRDKRGPIDGLTQSDFTVLDNGKPRQIAAFSVARASDQIGRAQLAAGSFTNKVNQSNDPPVAATVVLFDSLNTQFADQAAARYQAVKMLKSLDPQNPVAIYALGNGLRVLHDFTDDHVGLARSLERYRGENSRLLTDSIDGHDEFLGQLHDDFLGQLIEPLQRYSSDRRTAMTLSAMRAIADRMAGVPGRKNLIWISSAFPLTLTFNRSGADGVGQSSVTYTGATRDAAVALDRSNVAVYPVNAGNPRDAARSQLDRQIANRAVVLPVPVQLNGSRERETMQLLAEWTGGRAYLNDNDIRGAIRQAMDDAAIVYTLGFYVDAKDLNGSYHEVRVKTNRKGLEVRHRQGYFATALSAPSSKSLADTVVTAAFAPIDATGIGLTASLTPLPADPASFTLSFAIDMQNVRLEEKDGKWTGGLTFLAVDQATDGRLKDSAPTNIAINITDERRKALLKDGLTFRLIVKPAAEGQMRLAVVDQLSGQVGSLRLRLPAKP